MAGGLCAAGDTGKPKTKPSKPRKPHPPGNFADRLASRLSLKSVSGYDRAEKVFNTQGSKTGKPATERIKAPIQAKGKP